uniref:Vacuolar protein-sorting-associated protein 11 homolog n=1 Tax=Rhizophora mucronata TaxID=61149 RepID=A0A2P2J827_RHIMU
MKMQTNHLCLWKLTGEDSQYPNTIRCGCACACACALWLCLVEVKNLEAQGRLLRNDLFFFPNSHQEVALSELLEKENGRRMGLEGEIELEATIEEADGAIVTANRHLTSAAGTALDLPSNLLGNRALSAVLVLEELEFPPLIHSSPSLFQNTPLPRYDKQTERRDQEANYTKRIG